nr:sigma factor [Candidatus Blastococcus massiliensis]
MHGIAVRAFGLGPDAGCVTQRTFASAWTGRAGFRPDQGPRSGWLVGICRRTIADTQAREQERREKEAPLPQRVLGNRR